MPETTQDLAARAQAKMLAGGQLSRVEAWELADALTAALAREEALLKAIKEASDPDFLFSAMDNVRDMDVTLTDFSVAASKAIRAALEVKP